MAKEHTGWWPLGVLAVLTVFGLYVAAYYATVQPGLSLGSRRDTLHTLTYQPHYGRLGGAGELLFRPVHLVDRQLRPAYWSEQIDDLPRVPAEY
ncbi:MAG TPA: hypothetical protein VHB77_05155 [Planctomycetaceae bacterium]|nr:hypothetical protein [Planctomycetaceae bacterium]